MHDCAVLSYIVCSVPVIPERSGRARLQSCNIGPRHAGMSWPTTRFDTMTSHLKEL